MKPLFQLMIPITTALLLAGTSLSAFAQTTKEAISEAARDNKQVATKTADATKKTSKKVTSKTANTAEKSAKKVRDKIQ